jgi:hypothetical protein
MTTAAVATIYTSNFAIDSPVPRPEKDFELIEMFSDEQGPRRHHFKDTVVDHAVISLLVHRGT